MAEIIRKAVNKFTKGLVMDFSPENTKNDTLTHALNATLLTFNGNELSLQNDMGNARVETAYLPEGYIPVGTCEYGGIIYIVSYNPLEDKSQIGCFPSPERNVSNDELGELNATLNNVDFQNIDKESYSGELKNNSKFVLLKHNSLNPGDKFIICANDDLYKESVKDLLKDSNPIANPRIALNVVSIEDSGKITYLNSDLRNYDVGNFTYHILGTEKPNDQETSKKDIDSYRNVLSSGYNVFRSKTSGKLAILAELIMIDSFSLTHNVIPKTFTKYEGDSAEEVVDPGYFDVVLYSDIAPQVTADNFNTVPKLRYYYLKESQGYLTCVKGKKTLFTDDGAYNNDFFNIYLSDIYTLPKGVSKTTLGSSGQFGFPRANTYHGNMLEGTLGSEDSYTRFKGGQYHLVHKEQIKKNAGYFYETLNASIYKYETVGEYKEIEGEASISDGNTYYVKSNSVAYLDANGNKEHEGKPLYKKSDAIKVAPKEIIEDTSITKYVYIQSDEYLQITYDPNNPDHRGPFYSKTSAGGKDVYTEVSVEAGDTCYIKTHKTVLESIGNQILDISNYGIIYYKDGEEYLGASQEEIKDYWDGNSNLTLYYANKTEDFKEATQEEILNYDLLGLVLYYKDHYVKVDSNMIGHTVERLYIKVMSDAYVPYSEFQPNEADNYIEGSSTIPKVTPIGEPISIHKIGDFLVTDKSMEYKDLCLASLKIPSAIFKKSSQDFPFKYSYTIVPCMDYGKLDHLAVSNTVNFNNLRAFSKSNFTTWKYHIDGNQLRLTFGVEVFDTFETTKVDGLILEFYDLWGFAGSLEISNKKAYSGLYTKIISLNTLGSLSKKKIHSNCKERHEKYQRNINIQTVENTFQINGNPVGYVDDVEGWRFSSDVENDCGTLYSNLIYGVKTYLRRTSGKIGSDTYKEEYIPKKEFFLYTLPIYNDFYYSVSDFSTLENPELDLVLTYKLSDSSTKQVYIEDSRLPQGYCANDSQMIRNYMGGVYNNETLSAIKYYKYSGKSELYLEVGLKEEYNKIGLSYDSRLNDYFKCDLQLLSDTNEVFSVKSANDSEGLLSVQEYLNYNNSGQISISPKINQLGFFDGQYYKNTYSVTSTTPYSFINNTPKAYIDLRYEFVVGHKFVINNIKPEAVPMPVLCALLHKNDSGNYNYSDFNMTAIPSIQDNVEVTKVYSDFIYYNSLYGSAEDFKAMFGICRQVPDGILAGTKSVTLSLEVDLEKTSIPGKYNSGEILKQAQTRLGKLSFCSPHAHGVDGINGGKVTNINIKDHTLGYNVEPTACDLCNLALNTFNSVNYNSEFISTTTGKISEAGKRIFSGLDDETLTKFNTCLMETMKGIYAYNPDYTSHLISTGDISLVDNAVQFTSNIISTNAALTLPEGSVFNDFISIGTIFVSKYLEYLTRYSNIKTLDFEGKPLKQVNFTPNYNFCGNAPEYYLVSALTYNIPYPTELLEELSFSASDMFAVKHHDGTSEVMFGVPNQKTLYGYIENHIQPLDVSNYQIDKNGILTVNTPSISEYFWWSHNIETDSTSTQSSSVDTSVDINGGVSVVNNSTLMTRFIQATCHGYETGTSSVPFRAQVSLGYSGPTFNGSPSFKDAVIWKDGNSVFVYTTNPDLWCTILVASNSNYASSCEVTNQGYEHDITSTGMSCGGKVVILNGDYSTIVKNANTEAIKTIVNGGNNDTVEIGQVRIQVSRIRNSYSELFGKSYTSKDVTIESGSKSQGHYLFELTISALHFNIQRTSYLQHMQGYILPAVNTVDYTTASSTYEIKDNYKQSRFKYTTLTVNDLMYEPNISGHRLYVKNNNTVNNSAPSNLIYYRAEKGNWDSSYNVLHLFTGPCFINQL